MNRIWNPELGRAAEHSLFGIALYTGEVVNDVFRGTHQGATMSAEKANAWVYGGPLPDDLIKVYP